MAVYDSKNKLAEESDYLGEKIAHALNEQLQSSNLNFNARFYKEDNVLIREMESTTLPPANSGDYYKELLSKYEGDLFVSANYVYDSYNNNLIIEKITIYSNYKIPGTERYQVSAGNVTVENNPGAAPALRSAVVPGWGQIYKAQKTKGYMMLSSEVLLLTGALVSQSMRSYSYEQAMKNTHSSDTYFYYLDNYSTYGTVRNVCFIGAGAVYLYSLADAMVLKNKPVNSTTSVIRKFQLLPQYTENSYGFSINYKLNKF